MPSPAPLGPVLVASLALGGCGEDASPAPLPGTVEPTGTGLLDVHTPDADKVDAWRRAFSAGELIQGVLPPEAMRHLYLTWSDSYVDYYSYYSDEDAYWEAFNARYGTIPSPFPDATYPAGFGVADDGLIGIDCLLCHAGRVQDRTVIGLGNNRLDLRAFVEDLKALPAEVDELKAMPPPAPYDALVAAIPDVEVPEPYASLEIPTAAAGATDGIGLGLLTSVWYAEPPEGMNTFTGYQDPPPWWTMRKVERLYTDGSAPAEGIYTMMSTLLAFGLDLAELAAYVPTFEAMQSYLWTLEAPRWADEADLPPIDEALAARGAEVFATECARCHGGYTGDVFPNVLVTPDEIGTDDFRATRFTEVEAGWFNGFIPGEADDMEATGQYLAPALTGVWASAPYLHNGSVPTLRALLQPELRPTRWRRSGADLDADDVGLTYEVVDAPTDRDTVEGRKVVDTTVEAMGHGGHDIPVGAGDVDALLEHLKTL